MTEKICVFFSQLLGLPKAGPIWHAGYKEASIEFPRMIDHAKIFQREIDKRNYVEDIYLAFKEAYSGLSDEEIMRRMRKIEAPGMINQKPPSSSTSPPSVKRVSPSNSVRPKKVRPGSVSRKPGSYDPDKAYMRKIKSYQPKEGLVQDPSKLNFADSPSIKVQAKPNEYRDIGNRSLNRAQKRVSDLDKARANRQKKMSSTSTENLTADLPRKPADAKRVNAELARRDSAIQASRGKGSRVGKFIKKHGLKMALAGGALATIYNAGKKSGRSENSGGGYYESAYKKSFSESMSRHLEEDGEEGTKLSKRLADCEDGCNCKKCSKSKRESKKKRKLDKDQELLDLIKQSDEKDKQFFERAKNIGKTVSLVGLGIASGVVGKTVMNKFKQPKVSSTPSSISTSPNLTPDGPAPRPVIVNIVPTPVVSKRIVSPETRKAGFDPKTGKPIVNVVYTRNPDDLKKNLISESIPVIPPEKAREILEDFADLTKKREKIHKGKESPFLLLSPREEELLQMIVDGKPNKVIADNFGISPNTVRNHLASIFSKIQVNNRTEAALKAFKAEREKVPGVEPVTGKLKSYPKEYESFNIKFPDAEDMKTMDNIILAVDELRKHLSTYGTPVHHSKIYKDAISAVNSALLSWRNPILDKAAAEVLAHRFLEAKKLILEAKESMDRSFKKTQKFEDSFDISIEEKAERKLAKQQEYRSREYAKRRLKTHIAKVATGKYRDRYNQ